MVPVVAVLRRVASSEDAWPEATLQRVSLELVAAGLPSSREMRLGFPPQEERRREEVRGLAAELAATLSLDFADLCVCVLVYIFLWHNEFSFPFESRRLPLM